MPSGSKQLSKRAGLLRWLESHDPKEIDGLLFRELVTELAPVSNSYLRQLLRDSGVRLSADVEGVVTSSLQDAERTLRALAETYSTGQRDVRSLVIEAKTRVRAAIAREGDAAKRQEREEVLLWIMTWLENPESFPLWLNLRQRAGSR